LSLYDWAKSKPIGHVAAKKRQQFLTKKGLKRPSCTMAMVGVNGH